MGRLSKLRVVDPVLTQLAVGYTNAELVGSILLPFAQVEKEAGKIPRFGRDAFRIYRTERAIRAKSNRMNPENLASVDFVLDEHDLEYPIDYREEAESAFPLQAHAVQVVSEGIRLSHEKMVADLVQDPASYPVDHTLALAGTDQFSDPASDPEGVIDDARNTIRSKVVREPNTLVIGYRTWRALKRHPQLRAILADDRPRLLQLADLRELFEIENVVVGRAVYADAADNFADVWGDTAILAYVPANAGGERSAYDPSFGYTLQKRGNPTVDIRTEDGKLELVRATDIFRPYLLGAEAGFLLTSTVAP